MTKTDPDLSLESDRLEQYLEKVTPEQPVVVIQYRNRGVSSWVFFPLIVIIPLGAILIYHRFVVERYRIQDTRSRRVTNAPAPSTELTTTVPVPTFVTTALSSPSVPAGQSTGPADGATNRSGGVPADGIEAPAPARDSAPAHAKENPAPVASIAQPPPRADGFPTDQGKKAGPRLRSILPNPFALDDPPGAPATKAEGARLADQGGTISAPAGSPSKKSDAESKEQQDRGGGADTLVTHAADARANAAGQDDGAGPAAVGDEHATEPSRDRRPASKDGNVAVPALQPLPSKEESLHQIAEEAAKKQAEIMARDEIRETEIRARRYEERVKFREELREILRVHGNQAGPEIDKLSRRYGYDVDSDKYQQAIKTWRSGRISVLAKVRLIRSLELPESVILNFMSDDLHLLVRSRNGPRNENEVRVRAAQKLLGFELPAADPSLRPGAGAFRRESSGPARTPTAPANGAGPRPQ